MGAPFHPVGEIVLLAAFNTEAARRPQRAVDAVVGSGDAVSPDVLVETDVGRVRRLVLGGAVSDRKCPFLPQ